LDVFSAGLYDCLTGPIFLLVGQQLFKQFEVPAPNHWGYLQLGARMLVILGLFRIGIRFHSAFCWNSVRSVWLRFVGQLRVCPGCFSHLSQLTPWGWSCSYWRIAVQPRLATRP